MSTLDQMPDTANGHALTTLQDLMTSQQALVLNVSREVKGYGRHEQSLRQQYTEFHLLSE